MLHGSSDFPRNRCASEKIAYVVPLNVGGRMFQTTRDTLEKSSWFSRMLKSGMSLDLDENGAVFIDRNGDLFHHVLNYLRTGELDPALDHTEKNTLCLLRAEASYYALDGLLTELSQRLNPPESPLVFEHIFDGDNNGVIRHLSANGSSSSQAAPGNFMCPRCAGGVGPGCPNPHTTGTLRVSASEHSYVVNPEAILERNIGRAGACYVDQDWIQIDFGKVRVRPTKYTLRVPGSDDRPYRCEVHGLTGMSCWRLVGSHTDSSGGGGEESPTGGGPDPHLTVLDVRQRVPYLDIDHISRDYDENMPHDWRKVEMDNLVHTFQVQNPSEEFFRFIRVDNCVEVEGGDADQAPGAAHKCLHFCGFELYGDVLGLDRRQGPIQLTLLRESSSLYF